MPRAARATDHSEDHGLVIVEAHFFGVEQHVHTREQVVALSVARVLAGEARTQPLADEVRERPVARDEERFASTLFAHLEHLRQRDKRLTGAGGAHDVRVLLGFLGLLVLLLLVRRQLGGQNA